MAPDLVLLKDETQQGSSGVRLAIEGCGHGTLNNIYSSITAACKAKSWPGVDLLIIGGDFQAVRNSYDLNAMAVPAKYREIGDFQEYYSGKRKAQYLTIFIGGNHEASNHLTELYYGGWVAPQIYYMGAANVLRFGPLRIAAMSGIWKGYHYRKPHYERLPYTEDDKKSVYHVRALDVRKLLQIRTQVDIGLSHDWPQGIQWCGDWRTLFRQKKFLEEDARSGRLGNVAAKDVLLRLRPRYWFSAHLHTKFTALVKHDDVYLNEAPIQWDEVLQQEPNTEEIEIDLDNMDTTICQPYRDGRAKPMPNSDEIQLDLEDSDEEEIEKEGDAADGPAVDPNEIPVQSTEDDPDRLMTTAAPITQPHDTRISEDIRAQLPDSFKRPPPLEKLPYPKDIQNKETKFLALSKCLPGRDFLQLIEIPATSQSEEQGLSRPFRLEYDKEWLAITRTFNKDLKFGNEQVRMPGYEGDVVYRKRILDEEAWVGENLVAKDKMTVPEDFELTAPIYDPSVGIHTKQRPVEYANPQMARFCSLLNIDNPLDMDQEERSRREAQSASLPDESSARGGRGGGHGHSRGGRGGRGRGRGRGRAQGR